MNIPVVIPAYEPDERLVTLCDRFQKAGFQHVMLVDDGSGEAYEKVFLKAQEAMSPDRCVRLTHAVNLGKGRALKTAFDYILRTWPDAPACATADADGQHIPEDIEKCVKVFLSSNEHLILGVRDFNGRNVPGKSVFGNKLTRRIMHYLCGVSVSDTQTGLRVIPADFMRRLLGVPGERFEFETNMLIYTKRNHVSIKEVPIHTIYDSKEEHSTHFRPIVDSIRIYKIFGRIFLRFVFSSLSSAVLDLMLFHLFCGIMKGMAMTVPYIIVATVFARIISAFYNYLLNYKIVFHSEAPKLKSGMRYAVLALIQVCASALFVTMGARIMPYVQEVWIKAFVDTILFFISYGIQRRFVFE